MKIELRNVKHAAFASTDSECFEASVYIDGSRVGTARDDGHGGMMVIEPRELQQRLDAYGATLPAIVVSDSGVDCVSSFVFQPDAESLVADALAAWLANRDMQRVLKHCVLFMDADGNLRQTAKTTPTNLARWVQGAVEGKGVFAGRKHVLNAMAPADALAVYMGAAP